MDFSTSVEMTWVLLEKFIMKKSLSHLSEDKQEELKLITERILNSTEPIMIILFGSYARGDYKDGPHQQGHGRLTIHKTSDYDILIITETMKQAEEIEFGSELRDKFKDLKLSASPKIIARHLDFVNDKLLQGQYFFKDIIKKDGVVLYDSGSTTLYEERPLALEKQKQIAQEHYDQWFGSAKDFYKYFDIALKNEDYKISAFNLHQACEHALKAVLLVFSNYSPDEHYLAALTSRACEYCDDLLNIFPRETKEDEALYCLLEYAYIGARYDKNYNITKEQLEMLSEYTKKLHELTEKICKERIESFV